VQYSFDLSRIQFIETEQAKFEVRIQKVGDILTAILDSGKDTVSLDLSLNAIHPAPAALP
jgi:hypothetical protein